VFDRGFNFLFVKVGYAPGYLTTFNGQVYLVDNNSNSVVVFDADLNQLAIIANVFSTAFISVAVNSDRSVYVSDDSGTVRVFDSQGTHLFDFLLPGAPPETGMQFGTDGALYVAGTLQGSVLKMSYQGALLNQATGATISGLTRPVDVSLDASGRVYVVDAVTSKVFVLDQALTLLTTFNLAGNPSITTLCFDTGANAWLCDETSSTVDQYSPLVVGTAGYPLAAPIFNAANVPLNVDQGSLPDLSETLTDWMQPLLAEKIGKVVSDATAFQVVETTTPVPFNGFIVPLKAWELSMKPIGQRTWRWFQCYADAALPLFTDDVIKINGESYRIMSRDSYGSFGYFVYDVVQDWQASAPMVRG